MTLEIRSTEADFVGERGHTRLEIRRQVLNRQRIRDRQVLFDSELLDQDGTLRQQAKAIEYLQPGLAIGDCSRELTEHPDLTGVGHDRGRDQVDENLRGHAVEPAKGERLALVQVERLDPQRAQAAVILSDLADLNQAVRRRHVYAVPRATAANIPTAGWNFRSTRHAQGRRGNRSRR